MRNVVSSNIVIAWWRLCNGVAMSTCSTLEQVAAFRWSRRQND